jgi:hypothetical protein
MTSTLETIAQDRSGRPQIVWPIQWSSDFSSNEKSRTPNESEVRHIATATKVKAVFPSVHYRTDHNSRNGFNAGER